MIENNVIIRHYKKRKLVGVQELHNIWTDYGHQFLAELVAASVFSPLTGERDDRLKYFALGMGSTKGGVSINPTVSAIYPAGSDPNSSAGNEYNVEYPVVPPIGTLELPVKKSGSDVTAYPGDPGDVWLFGPSDGVFFTHQDLKSVTMHVPIDTSTGDITGIFTPFEVIEVSEAALLTSLAGVNTAYNSVVAYISFDKIPLDDDTQIEFIWSVRFLSQ